MNDPMAILTQNPMLSLVVAAFVIIFREVIVAVKALMQASPTEKLAASNDKLAAALAELSTSLKLLNSEMKANSELQTMRQHQILDEVRAIRSRVKA